MTLRKLQTLTLMLLLLCAMCVAPVMASTMATSVSRVVEDGVHLIKFDDSPTKLDLKVYVMDVRDNFIVDGNQFYWVRIGNEKTKDLSMNAIAYFACKGVIIVGAAGVAYAVAPLIAGGSGASVVVGGATVTVSAGQLAALVGAGIGYIADVTSAICSEIEKLFVNSNYRYVASDGTILLCLNKNNVAGIAELNAHGLDITKLTHLSVDGVVIKSKSDL